MKNFLNEIAQTKLESPTYFYDAEQIQSNCNAYIKAFKRETKFFYALKANNHLGVLKLINALGFGADVVSGGELLRAVEAGFPGNQIIFSGVAKTDHEIEIGVDHDIFSFNVESFFELEAIEKIAGLKNKIARISLRLNPNINAKTHPKIATGLASTKFGIPLSDLKDCLKFIRSAKHLSLKGISCHLGSQITDLRVYKEGAQKMLKISEQLKDFQLEFLDLGGGLGVSYRAKQKSPTPSQLAQTIEKELKQSNLTLVLEPGRSIVANAGVYVASVVGVKKNGKHHFVIINGGMNHLLRPALYDAYHEIISLDARKGKKIKCSVVGPICETSDTLGENRNLVLPKAGDRIAILTAGAYGATMASQYNCHALPQEILI